jgi:hypothetical protein
MSNETYISSLLSPCFLTMHNIHSSAQCSPPRLSSITLTSQTRMSSTKSGSSCSPGHTSHGPVVSVVQSRAKASGRVQGKTSTVLTSTFLVCHSLVIPLHINLTIHSNGNGHIHPPVRPACRSPEAVPHKSLFPSLPFSPSHLTPPKALGDSASRAVAVVLLDLAFVKLGCYFLNVQGQSQFVDLIAYGGYKFVGYAESNTLFFIS